MGILSALNTGVAGLNGQGEALSIYSDNIANANTAGFKTSRPEFQDVVAKSLKGTMGGNQIGTGARLAAVSPINAQGEIKQTESPTDLAIVGDGFFVMKGQDGQTYTRDGKFRFDKDGKLTNADGYKVQGFMADENGKVTSKMGDISVDRAVIDAKKTSKVDMFMNLDLKAAKEGEFDPANPDKTNDFATGVTVYDTAGNAHVVTMYFNKVEDGMWAWHGMVDGSEINGGKPGTKMEQASGTLKFDTDGRLMEQKMNKNAFNFNNGALPDQQIAFNFGKDKKSGGAGVEVTQYGTASETYKNLQDGYTAGTLSGLSFNDDGMLVTSYTNGENINLAQIATGRFESNEGLFKLGQNRFRESRLSGQVTIGAPGTGGRGRVSPKTIEESKTDIAAEFINLMGAQRTFQANSKVIGVADDMLQNILNIKRG